MIFGLREPVHGSTRFRPGNMWTFRACALVERRRRYRGFHSCEFRSLATGRHDEQSKLRPHDRARLRPKRPTHVPAGRFERKRAIRRLLHRRWSLVGAVLRHACRSHERFRLGRVPVATQRCQHNRVLFLELWRNMDRFNRRDHATIGAKSNCRVFGSRQCQEVLYLQSEQRRAVGEHRRWPNLHNLANLGDLWHAQRFLRRRGRSLVCNQRGLDALDGSTNDLHTRGACNPVGPAASSRPYARAANNRALRRAAARCAPLCANCSVALAAHLRCRRIGAHERWR
jgi:hypothetical protein